MQGGYAASGRSSYPRPTTFHTLEGREATEESFLVATVGLSEITAKTCATQEARYMGNRCRSLRSGWWPECRSDYIASGEYGVGGLRRFSVEPRIW